MTNKKKKMWHIMKRRKSCQFYNEACSVRIIGNSGTLMCHGGAKGGGGGGGGGWMLLLSIWMDE